MNNQIRILEDPKAIQLMLRRIVSSGGKVGIQVSGPRGTFEALSCDGTHLLLRMGQGEREGLGLKIQEPATLFIEDRTMRFEGVASFEAALDLEGVACSQMSLPRTFRRTDTHRFASFVPDQVIPCSFSTARGALLEGRIQGLSPEGLELALAGKQDVKEVFRIGEDAAIDIPMEGGQRFGAKTKVAYFGEACVGLRFTDANDKVLIKEFKHWLDTQIQTQAKQDQEAFGGTGAIRRAARLPDLPQVKVLVDRDPLLLFVSEREDMAKRLAEALGRKFGVAWLNHIKGHLRPQLKDLGVDESDWGRVRLILVHHQLKLASPLEFTQQVVSQEGCTIPVLIAGTSEDAELKVNRAVAAGAVNYLVMEPFKILSVLKAIDDTLKLFS